MDRLLTLSEVQEIIPLHRATIYRKMKRDDFPKACKLGQTGGLRWWESEIKEWLRTLPRFGDDKPAA